MGVEMSFNFTVEWVYDTILEKQGSSPIYYLLITIYYSAMLNQRHRFHGYGSLKSVYQRGQSVRGPLIHMKFSQRDPNRPYRVAVVVSRKVSKSAVVRNRIRRRIYEIIRKSDHRPPNGTDLVFTVFGEEVATMEATKVQNLVEKLLQKTAPHWGISH